MFVRPLDVVAIFQHKPGEAYDLRHLDIEQDVNLLLTENETTKIDSKTTSGKVIPGLDLSTGKQTCEENEKRLESIMV